MNNELLKTQHSKLGIASCVIALTVWIYLAVLIYLFFYNEEFGRKFNDFLPKNSGMSDFSGLGTALGLMVVMFLIIPVCGHLLGLIFGLIGVIQKTKKKLFAVAGLIMNALIFVGGLVLNIIGILSNRQ